MHLCKLDDKTVKLLFNFPISQMSGGWQGLVELLRERFTDSCNGVIGLSEEEYERLVRYIEQGKGGYQKLFQAILDCEVE